MRKAKIIVISIIFYIVGILLTFAMFNLWFWVFKSPLLQKIFIIITLLGLMKYVWQHTEWTINNLKDKNT
jgi:hypothetical protein